MSIWLKNISKSFGSDLVLDDITQEIPHGSLTALLGPSGSGKSTLLRIIAGLEQADSGRAAVVEGRPDAFRNSGLPSEGEGRLDHVYGVAAVALRDARREVAGEGAAEILAFGGGKRRREACGYGYRAPNKRQTLHQRRSNACAGGDAQRVRAVLVGREGALVSRRHGAARYRA